MTRIFYAMFVIGLLTMAAAEGPWTFVLAAAAMQCSPL